MNLANEIRRFISRLRGVISLAEFGAVLDGNTDDFLAVGRAAASGIKATLVVDGPCKVGTNVTIPATMPVRFEGVGAFTGSGVVTYTPATVGPITGAMMEAPVVGSCSFTGYSGSHGGAGTPILVRSGKICRIEGIFDVLIAPTRFTSVVLTIPAGFRPCIGVTLLCGGTSGAAVGASEFAIDTAGNVIFTDVGSLPQVGNWQKIYGTYVVP